MGAWRLGGREAGRLGFSVEGASRRDAM